MKRIKIQNRCLVTCMMLMAMLMSSIGVKAQNVTISPQNGSMICSDAEGLGTGTAFAMWRHEQLALMMIASGDTDLTEDGILKNHRNWFNTCNNCTFRSSVSAAEKATFIDCGWQDENGYYTISLPKGYRFTGYRFELSHDITDTGQGFTTVTNKTAIWAETGDDFGDAINSVTLQAVPNSASDVQVYELKRTGNDMGNILYFKVTTPDDESGSQFYDLTFRHVELTFAADAETPIDILPSTQGSDGHSLLEVPFNTGKVDVGQITSKRIHLSGNRYTNRISYSLDNLTDLSANMLLYEYNSTELGTGFDGTSGIVAYDKGSGSITTSGNYFRFAPKTVTDPNKPNEQVYVLETPVSAVQAGNVENPVQFRITGATINYTNSVNKTFHITCVIDGTTYYLDTNGQFTTSIMTVWEQDNAGHIYSGSSYLQGTNVNMSTGPLSGADVYTITDNGTISYGTTNRYLKANATQQWQRINNQWVLVTVYNAQMTNNSGSSYTTASTDEIIAAGSSNATIYIYDKEGNRDSRYQNGITISSTDKVELSGLNNDAILFGVKGGDVALLNFNVNLQALNPYIDQMTVALDVKKDATTNVKMTLPFTSDDFSVGGDRFEFYLPAELEGKAVNITFEDLYSKYGDETYDHITGTEHSSSRYNYVMSDHHQQYPSDNIYNNTAEAASSKTESVRLSETPSETYPSTIRTKVGTVGDQAFVFNNADELATHSGYYREFPFTLNNYATQNGNQYLNTKPTNGQFIAAHFTAEEVNTSGKTKTFYVFTTDETRYNIAPTTATQHRSYAYYTMVVLVQVGTYVPTATFNPIYTNAFYEDENGNGTTGDFYGVTITAPSNIDAPLASDVAINKAIVTQIKTENPNATDDDVAAEMKKILYLDASPLSGVYHTTPVVQADQSYAVASFDDLKEKFDANALVFLPAGMTEKYNNFAYANKGEVKSFKSANNIILTDKHPFYSPYNIQVDAANYAKYERKKSKSTYADIDYATIIMPFTIQIDETSGVNQGVHYQTTAQGYDADYGRIKFLQMNATQAFATNENYDVTAFFTGISTSETASNTPYAINIVDRGNNQGTFTLIQKGSNIIATPDAAKAGLFSAETITSTGNLGSSKYTFSHKGLFNGTQIGKNDGNGVFYFANNGFYSSKDLNSQYSKVGVYPFRSVYNVDNITTNTNSTPAKISYMVIVEGENPDFGGITTGIKDANRKMSGIILDKGTITIMTDVDNTYRIVTAEGQVWYTVVIPAGESRTFNVPAGVYLVNGTKVLVQ